MISHCSGYQHRNTRWIRSRGFQGWKRGPVIPQLLDVLGVVLYSCDQNDICTDLDMYM